MTEQTHIQMIEVVTNLHFKQTPKFIKRIAVGISNEVYEVGLQEKEVIARLCSYDRYLMGSHDHIPKFKALNITVPDILFEDYSKKVIALSYQIQSKIPGNDLGEVITTLSDNQLRNLAQEIAVVFNKVKTIPSSHLFGVIWGGGDNEVSNTWTERMQIWIEESLQRGKSTGVMDVEIEAIAINLYSSYESYFSSLTPTTYYGDICSKNVMIDNGYFSGLVDLDGLTQGDPLEAVGRINLSWYGTHHGKIYTDAVMNELHLSLDQRKLVIMYSLLNKISWTCENGIQFNLNTTAEVDEEKAKKDKAIIRRLHSELQMLKKDHTKEIL